MEHIKDDIVRGSIGIIGTGTGLVVSALPQIEAWLRITSLLAGITLAIVTTYITIKKHLNKP